MHELRIKIAEEIQETSNQMRKLAPDAQVEIEELGKKMNQLSNDKIISPTFRHSKVLKTLVGLLSNGGVNFSPLLSLTLSN